VKAKTIKADQVIGQQNVTNNAPTQTGPTMFDIGDDASASVEGARQIIDPNADLSGASPTFAKMTGNSRIEGSNFEQRVWVDEKGVTNHGAYVGSMEVNPMPPDENSPSIENAAELLDKLLDPGIKPEADEIHRNHDQ
jgi:hypothetical protein